MSNFLKHPCCNKNNAVKCGRYRRRSDGRTIQRYKCKTCSCSFSQATFDPAYYQKKRQLNHKCMMLLASCVSMRRIALVLGIHPITVARKLEYLSAQSQLKWREESLYVAPDSDIQFDELQTIEHTKCKPLSIAMAVTEKGRKILGFHVSQMPATGHLAAISRKKYGYRKDLRVEGMTALFEQLTAQLAPTIRIKSDECSFYQPIVNTFFPAANYTQFKGQKGAISGQGELKKTKIDPLFSINHTFAMLRANINRLVRKTWCTTKKVSRLIDHLNIYLWVHNSKLTA